MIVKPGWHLAALLLLAGIIVGGCETSSSVTSVATAPDSPKCQVAVGTPPLIAAEGGSSTFSITAEPECAWTASTSATWISGISPTSGQGNGNVAFRVAANDGAAARDGEIAVNNSRVRVSQRAPCRYVLTPAMVNIAASGGGGQIAVATASDCAWSAAADGDWITVAAPSSGTGNGTVSFTVALNTGSERTGSVVIGGQRATIVQSGSTSTPTQCSYNISPSTVSIPATAGAMSVEVQAQSGCGWGAISNAPWITITSAANGTGNGGIALAIAANPGAERTGTVTIASRTLTVTQAAAGSLTCAGTIAPPSVSAPATASTGSVTVTAVATCSWTATSNAVWITVTAGATGVGNGSVGYSVAANTGAARTGTVSIAGQTFTVSQAAGAAPCSYSIAPIGQTAPASASSGTVNVTSGAGCAWTAASNASWLGVTAGATGTGNGTVGYSVAANTGAARSGTLTIAGQTFTVTQDAGAAPCTFSIAPPSQNAPDTASSGSVAVTTTAGCAWTATSNAAWLTITSGASGTGNGSVAFSIAANTGSARSGTLTVAGQTFTVNQAAPAPSCTYSIAPPSQTIVSTGGVASVNVTTSAGCAWTASSNATWIVITNGASGTGNGTVMFAVATNIGGSRTGTLTIAGQTATVQQQQSGGGSGLALAPLSRP